MKTCAIVGFGCAGYHAAKSLRQCSPDCRIDVYSNTDTAPANPMLTTYYVAGKITRREVFPLGEKEDIVQSLGINLLENAPVTHVDALRRTVSLAGGATHVYDDIVLASGSHPFIPPIPGLPQKGIYVMRTVQDADRFLAAIQGGMKSALVIGASWVGIKVVEALHAHGVPTALADMAPYIFPTAALPETAAEIHRHLESLGIGLLFGKGISSMRQEADGIVTVFSDGTEYKSDAAAPCLGLRPTVDYLDKNQLEIGKGVRVNRRMESSAPHVYAVGDCCEAQEVINGQYLPVNLWANAALQGRIAGRNIAGHRDEFQGNFIHNITHFLHMDFIGLGDNRAQGEHLAYTAPEGWRFDMILRDGRPACINILENRGLSGPLKAALLKCITTPPEKMSLDAVIALRDAGLPESIIAKIGGSNT